MTTGQRISLVPVALLMALSGVALAQARRVPDARIADLVEAGTLRVALGLGSPALAMRDPKTGEARGPALELGSALAARMGVKLQPVEYPSPGAIMEGLRTNAWDLAFFVIDPARSTEVDFSQPYMQSDFTYLVSGKSSILTVSDVDEPGIRVAVSRSDASDLRLSKMLKRAGLVRADTLAAALDLVRTGQADAIASARPVLLGLAASVPGSRILEGGFAVSAYGAAVPKGRVGHLAYVSEFIEEAKASGLVKQTIERYGLKGIEVAPAETPSAK
jgi:polar amino acid transport system substrate-binding protein